MKLPKPVSIIVGCLITLFLSSAPVALAQGPLDSETFLYQGVLRQSGERIEGGRELQFHL